jgi:uncharacterized protein (DUF952 family)
VILHFCPREDWDGSPDPYVAPSLDEEGFIHCSTPDQVTRVATALDPGRSDLVLLVLDETAIDVVWEDCYELGEEFPHVYGPIPYAAVSGVVPFPSEPDGSYSLPGDLPG